MSPDAKPADAPFWVAAALPEEVAALRRLPADERPPLLILKDGAERACEALRSGLLRERPRRLLLIGFAGALTPDLRAGEVHAVEEILGPPNSEPRHPMLATEGLPRATLASAPQLLCSQAEKEAFRASRGGRPSLVDLESWAIASLLEEEGVPYAVLRVVSDEFSELLPPAIGRAARPDGSVARVRLAMGVVIRPWEIPGLIRIGRRARRFSDRLADAVRAFARDLDA